MTLQMRNWRVDLSHILFLGFKGDSHAETFTLLTDFEEDFDPDSMWSWRDRKT